MVVVTGAKGGAEVKRCVKCQWMTTDAPSDGYRQNTDDLRGHSASRFMYQIGTATANPHHNWICPQSQGDVDNAVEKPGTPKASQHAGGVSASGCGHCRTSMISWTCIRQGLPA